MSGCWFGVDVADYFDRDTDVTSATPTPEPNESVGLEVWNQHDTAHEIDATMTVPETDDVIFDRTVSLDAG